MIQSFEDAGKLGNEITDTGLRSFASVSKNMQAIAVEATEFSRRSFEQSNSAVEKLFQVKSPESAAQVQMDFAKQAYESFVSQTTRMGELYADMAKEVYKPFEMLGAKVR
ncbi:phasin family protein [Aliihoeflea sp. PC F10.4]